jgi:hypothetical protein
MDSGFSKFGAGGGLLEQRQTTPPFSPVKKRLKKICNFVRPPVFYC